MEFTKGVDETRTQSVNRDAGMLEQLMTVIVSGRDHW